MVLVLLIVAAAACLAASFFTSTVLLAYVALGLALAGLVLIGVTAALRRRSSAAPSTTDESTEDDAQPGEDTEVPEADADLVLIIPGRKRYHRPGCEFADGAGEELTLGEAQQEGFTACTACAVPASVR